MILMESVVFCNYLADLAAASAFSKASSPAAIAALRDLIFAIIMRHFGRVVEQQAEIAVAEREPWLIAVGNLQVVQNNLEEARIDTLILI
jgi:hypothetical protein